ncbi:rhodanese-like domain-containing protein 11, chloroplastic [Amborella trichopoda]|uniref:rhodanese-like domain-containing protein 11, chloroplastic n=1 Tax=Amborella trichopoda TaxID=13333 RepID=UPI0009BE5643|nr:rhodanese-like domain-containing protein 11, chloroplastic [Amborella trichopoda]|eukprot:XP_011625115.2 rhodanese-like domain-containing protein 11, chloroplastic [Amborella trichopoda]
MEALRIPSLDTTNFCISPSAVGKTRKLRAGYLLPKLSSGPFHGSLLRPHRSHCPPCLIRMEADDPAKQMKEMADARKRWDKLIREGKVKALTPREAGYAIQLSNKSLLDVRPSIEHKKAWVKGSTWIPIFDVDNNLEFGTLSKKITNFVMGGWWSGVPVFSYDKQFISKVEKKFPKDADLIVACQKGLR